MRTDRRNFLTAASLAAGGSFFAPVVAKLRAEAAGEAPPKRVVFVLEGNGLPWQEVHPIGIDRFGMKDFSNRVAYDKRDAFREIPLKDHALPPALEPLTPFKDRVTVLLGLSGKMCSGGHSNDFGALGAYNAGGAANTTGVPRGETVDYALGRKLSSVFPQMSLGITPNLDDRLVNNCSATGNRSPLPTVCDPALAFQMLFGSAVGDRRGAATRKNVLDFLTADVARARQALPSETRANFDLYLGSLEGMRTRHQRLVEMEAILKKTAPPVTDKFTSKVETDRLDAHFDLAAAALVSGLTNVVTLASGVGCSYFDVTFTGLGMTMSKHPIGHGSGVPGKTWLETTIAIRKFHFELIARLAKKLQAVPEGNGTMLDNTLIVYTSDAAETHHSRCFEWPFVMIGSLGGKFKTGRYIEYPGHGAKGHKHIGNLYTTFLNAVGDKRETFGSPDPIVGKDYDQKGGLSELLV